MKTEKIRKLLINKGQEHLLCGFELLSEEEKKELLREISGINWEIFEEKLSNHQGKVEPLEGLGRKEILLSRDKFEEAGLQAIRAGKVGAVLLAGGQGTRLGSDAPKGAYNIGIKKPVYIFECLIKNLLEVTRKAGVFVPLFIMTSEKNDAATRAFLKEHDFFSYPEEEVYFFVQEMAPATDFSGKILLEERGRIAFSPNGNGGWFSSMKRAGLLDELKRRGVEWLNVFAVDNVLQRIADPLFVGATVMSGLPCGAKTVKKAAPHEKVGVLCKRGGIPDIVEYYELSEEMANAVGADGKYLYGDGVILNYLFQVSLLQTVAGHKLPVHRAKKKVPYFNGEKVVVPASENAYKYELLILDMVRLMGGVLPFEVEREKEFAPVKNPTGTDSVETARVLLEKNGVEL